MQIKLKNGKEYCVAYSGNNPVRSAVNPSYPLLPRQCISLIVPYSGEKFLDGIIIKPEEDKKYFSTCEIVDTEASHFYKFYQHNVFPILREKAVMWIKTKMDKKNIKLLDAILAKYV